uniref:HDC06391 n=1 Tax=Drosophila melanogaster TaxID=7227 RepID=Q6IGG0_DROME|nr:TPA_inf: HDC06391 [Drosophila melanogaster]
MCQLELEQEQKPLHMVAYAHSGFPLQLLDSEILIPLLLLLLLLLLLFLARDFAVQWQIFCQYTKDSRSR